RWLIPRVGDEADQLPPLLLWWIVLFSLSLLARYEPAAWRAALDLDRSPRADPLTPPLDEALAIGAPPPIRCRRPRVTLPEAAAAVVANCGETSPQVPATRSVNPAKRALDREIFEISEPGCRGEFSRIPGSAITGARRARWQPELGRLALLRLSPVWC